MADVLDPFDPQTIATKVITALDRGTQIQPFSASPGGLDLDSAYRVTPLIRATFETRGETITGRKIGFSNRQLWPVYGVEMPIWGYCTDRNTRALADTPSCRLASWQ